MPSKHSIRIEEVEGRAGVERSEPGGRAELDAGARGRALSGRLGRELRQELVEGALDRARRGLAVGELPAEVREQLTDSMIDELLAGRRGEAEILGPGGLLGDLTRRLVERAMAAELTEHLGYEPHAEPPGGTGNARNGGTPKTLLTDHGPVRIKTPRDRAGSYEPRIVPKGQRRLDGLDDKILALYAGGMTTREIETYLTGLYGPGVGRDTVSRITRRGPGRRQGLADAALGAGLPDRLPRRAGREDPRRPGSAQLRLLPGDRRQHRRRARRARNVVSAHRGRQVLDGGPDRAPPARPAGRPGLLRRRPDRLSRGDRGRLPKTWVQTCLVHQVRSSLRFVPYRDKRAVAADLKKIYTAVDRDHAETELEAFAEKWDHRYPMISASWIEHWERIVPFLAFPPDVRRVVYTTNTIEALNRQIRKIIKTRGSFPSEDSARKLIYLAITGAQAKWRHAYNWSSALAAFRIHFGDRLPDNAI
jgi:putative transposase